MSCARDSADAHPVSPRRHPAPWWLLLSALLACTPAPAPTTCNGAEHLCERRLDDVTFVMSHNAMSNDEDGWLLPNQNRSLAAQLADGVRGFMLDTYDSPEGPVLCHGFCSLGELPLVDGLQVFADFLDANPREVLWFVIQDAASPVASVDAFEAAGLVERTVALDPSQPLPTLGALIAAGTPLVVTTENDRSAEAPPWYQHAYSVAWDNDYRAETVDDFDCDVLRGNPDNPLFLLNHFLTAPVALPELAEVANTRDALTAHIDRCEAAWERPINAVAVDFYDIGATLEVVQEMNAGP